MMNAATTEPRFTAEQFRAACRKSARQVRKLREAGRTEEAAALFARVRDEAWRAQREGRAPRM